MCHPIMHTENKVNLWQSAVLKWHSERCFETHLQAPRRTFRMAERFARLFMTDGLDMPALGYVIRWYLDFLLTLFRKVGHQCAQTLIF